LKKPAEKEGITKEAKVNRVEIGNNKDLLKIGKVRDLSDHRKIGKGRDLSDHRKIEVGKDNRGRLKTEMGKGNHDRRKTGKDKDLSDQTNLEAIARDNRTVSKTIPQTGAVKPIGPHRERMAPKKQINKSY
jgi:hypothetical protein